MLHLEVIGAQGNLIAPVLCEDPKELLLRRLELVLERLVSYVPPLGHVLERLTHHVSLDEELPVVWGEEREDVSDPRSLVCSAKVELGRLGASEEDSLAPLEHLVVRQVLDTRYSLPPLEPGSVVLGGVPPEELSLSSDVGFDFCSRPWHVTPFSMCPR